MKYLMMMTLMLTISCGGELPKNCGDGILQSDEVCEMGIETGCHELGFAKTGEVFCNDCHSWDVHECINNEQES